MSPLAPVDKSLGVRRSARQTPGRGPVLASCLIVLAASVAMLAATVRWSVQTPRGQQLDQAAREAVYGRQATVDQVLSVLGYVSIGSVAVALTVCVALALARRRFAAAVAAGVLVAGANVSTQILKRTLIDRPDYGHLTINSLPSGHTTVVTSVVLAALLVAGAALRPLVVTLGTFAVTFTGASTLVAGWHRPSDVVAALAVCLGWGSALVLVLAVRRPGRFASATLSHALGSIAGVAAAGVLLVAIGVRPDEGWAGFGDAAVVLGALGLASALTVGVFARLSSIHAL